ncbi:MAG: hypothetical protein IPQ07_10175 [Myxococcales bacterium]|nr:hypothetical protein [Myxococcales bacterium]
MAVPLNAFAEGDDTAPAPDGGGTGDAPAGGDGAAAPAPAPDAGGGGGEMMGTYTKETWPLAAVERPINIAKGMIEIRADVFVNLSKDAVAKPFAIAPDIYYGVSDKLMVGLTHNTGLCLSGTDGGCGKVYNDVGFEGVFSLKRDAKMDLAAAGGLELASLDPMLARLNVGVRFKYRAGKIGIYVDPNLGLGLNKRDSDPVTGLGGNKEALSLPVKVGFQATPKLMVHVRTGIAGLGIGPNAGAPLSHFGDLFVIPVGVGALFAVSNKIDVGGEFFFPAVAGSDLASTDLRALIITGNIRL